MKKILILGAGKSSAHLIRYLAENSSRLSIDITIADIHTSHIPQHILSQPNTKAITLQKGDTEEYKHLIIPSDIVVSMLPAFMHIEVAKLCLEHSSHLITPSYISEAMLAMDGEIKNKDLIFLNEMGFDPGIDHMTTMKIYDEILAEKGRLISYKSYAGGLVATKNDNNPWHYKFSWNPRNVILAGQGGDIVYKEHNIRKVLTYENLFSSSEALTLSKGQTFDTYANRDSLKYEKLYGWEDIDTLLRGTLRHRGFCKAWGLLVSLGLTDNNTVHAEIIGKSYQDFYTYFLPETLDVFLAKQSEDIQEKLISIGFNDAVSTIEKQGTAAEILQSILEKKWKLEPTDTDRVVMVHLMEYEARGQNYLWESYLDLEGEDSIYTAMSKTVGMPIAFAVELILENKISQRGVLIPTQSEIYTPILHRLEAIGVRFEEVKQLL